MNSPIILISAMGRNRVIGTQNGMPWQVPEEYQQYLSFIQGQTVIMGRTTYEIFGADLTSMHNLVVSRSLPAGEDFQVFDSLEGAISAARALDGLIFVAGGASIYRQALPLADEMYLSFIKGNFEGIAFFPEFDLTNWAVVRRVEHTEFEFVHYRRK